MSYELPHQEGSREALLATMADREEYHRRFGRISVADALSEAHSAIAAGAAEAEAGHTVYTVRDSGATLEPDG